jgi:hypothetical protein
MRIIGQRFGILILVKRYSPSKLSNHNKYLALAAYGKVVVYDIREKQEVFSMEFKRRFYISDLPSVIIMSI